MTDTAAAQPAGFRISEMHEIHPAAQQQLDNGTGPCFNEPGPGPYFNEPATVHKPLTTAPLSSRRHRWEDRPEASKKYIDNHRKMLHIVMKKAEKALAEALARRVRDPALSNLQRLVFLVR